VGREKADIKPAQVLAEREKLAQHVMVSSGVFWWLHFADESTKVDFAHYVLTVSLPVLSMTVLDCCQWIRLPANTAPAAKNWLRTNCQRLAASKFTQLEALGLPFLEQC